MLSLSELIKKRVHIGHRICRGNPKMALYIWGKRNKVHIIDVSKTAVLLERSAAFLKQVAAEGKEILWCGTKKAAQGAIERAGITTQSPTAQYRWIGGTLTNFQQVKKSVTKYLHLEDTLEKAAAAEHAHYTKKELGLFQKMADRLRKSVGGLRNLKYSVGALVVVDVKQEYVAVREALDRNIPVVALVDTNSDPSGITYVIPGNDDAAEAVSCLIDYLAAAVQEGKKIRQENAAQALPDEKVVPDDALQAQLAAVEASLNSSEPKGARKAPSSATVGSRSHGPRRPSSGQGTERKDTNVRSNNGPRQGSPRPAGSRPAGTRPAPSRPAPKDKA